MESESFLNHESVNSLKIYSVHQKSRLMSFGSQYTIHDDNGLETISVKGRFYLLFPLFVILILIFLIWILFTQQSYFVIILLVSIIVFAIIAKIANKFLNMGTYSLSFHDNTGQSIGKSHPVGTFVFDTWKIKDSSGQILATFFTNIMKKRLGGLVSTPIKDSSVIKTPQSSYKVQLERRRTQEFPLVFLKVFDPDENLCYSVTKIGQCLGGEYRIESTGGMDQDLTLLSAVTMIESIFPPRSSGSP
ncbi:MAG: hypothetical protein ACXABG_02775 [Promethearchaeota archaeon]